MTQPSLNFAGPGLCGELLVFSKEWTDGTVYPGMPEIDWSPLLCRLPAGHDGRHFDEATGIPWDEA